MSRFEVIYEPKGEAKEYADLALNLYTGCDFGCTYCWARRFHKTPSEPRKQIIFKVQRDIERYNSLYFDKNRPHVLLCFNCDPYQTLEKEAELTRLVLSDFDYAKIPFKILTKSTLAIRDFDLYKPDDWLGVTLTHYRDWAIYEPKASSAPARIELLHAAKRHNIKTWVSLEPVIDPEETKWIIKTTRYCVDEYKIGKWNYHKTDIDWYRFAHEIRDLCEDLGVKYYLKENLQVYFSGDIGNKFRTLPVGG
jgi:DNA repair photolyase